MRIDRFYVVGRETSCGDVVFMQTYVSGGLPAGHWGELSEEYYAHLRETYKEFKG